MSEKIVKVDLPEPHHGRELFRSHGPDVVVSIHGDHGSGKGEVWIFVDDRNPEKILEIEILKNEEGTPRERGGEKR